MVASRSEIAKFYSGTYELVPSFAPRLSSVAQGSQRLSGKCLLIRPGLPRFCGQSGICCNCDRITGWHFGFVAADPGGFVG